MNLAEARALWPEARDLAARLTDEFCETLCTEKTTVRKRGRKELCRRFGGEVEPIAVILDDIAYDERLFLTKGPRLLAAAVTMALASFEEVRRLQGREKAKDFTTEAAMKCKEQSFLTFLAERHGLEPPLEEKRARTRLHSLLRVSSLRDINGNPQAETAWQDLRNEFSAWRRG